MEGPLSYRGWPAAPRREGTETGKWPLFPLFDSVAPRSTWIAYLAVAPPDHADRWSFGAGASLRAMAW